MNTNKDKMIMGVAIAVIVTVFVTLLVYDYNEEQRRKAELARFSGEHFCSEDASDLRANTVFLLDYSDPITDAQAVSVKDVINSSIRELSVREKLSALFINQKSFNELMAVCKPPHPKLRNKKWRCDGEIAGIDKTPFNQQTAKDYCDYKERVDDYLIKKITELSNNSSPSSPLVESLVKISMREDFSANITRKIVMFSDLAQNTDNYSFYPKRNRGNLPTASLVMAKEKINLRGVHVVIHKIKREAPPQKYTLMQNFWRELLTQAGADVEFAEVAE